MKYKFSLNITVAFILLCNFINIYADVVEDKCLLCSVDEKNCTVDPLSMIHKSVKCDFTKQVCFTKTDDTGRNERGCIDKDKCTEKCTACDSTFCNDRIIPYNRPACFNCQDLDCADPIGKKLQPEYCLYYDASSLVDCYVTKGDFDVKRGCFVGASQEDFECQGFSKNCSKTTCTNNRLDKSRPCNVVPVVLGYKCYSCNSKDNNRCTKKFNESIYEDCSARNGCYEKYADGVATRGCASSLNDEELKQCKDPEYKQCRYCDSPICNFEEINGAGKIIYSYIILIPSILSLWKFI